MIDYTDHTINGKCSDCGQCCGNFLPVSKEEVKRISEYVSAHGIKPASLPFPLTSEVIQSTCPFRDEAHRRCLIYEVRPMICKDYVCSKFAVHAVPDYKKYGKSTHLIDMRQTFFG